MEDKVLRSLLLVALTSQDKTEGYVADEKASKIIRKRFGPVFTKLCRKLGCSFKSEEAKKVKVDALAETHEHIRSGKFKLDRYPEGKLIAGIMSWTRRKATFLFKRAWDEAKRDKEKRKELHVQNISQIAGHPQGDDDTRATEVEEAIQDSVSLSPYESVLYAELLDEIAATRRELTPRDNRMIELLFQTNGDPTIEQIDAFEEEFKCDFASAKTRAKANFRVLYKRRNNDSLSLGLKT